MNTTLEGLVGAVGSPTDNADRPAGYLADYLLDAGAPLSFLFRQQRGAYGGDGYAGAPWCGDGQLLAVSEQYGVFFRASSHDTGASVVRTDDGRTYRLAHDEMYDVTGAACGGVRDGHVVMLFTSWPIKSNDVDRRLCGYDLTGERSPQPRQPLSVTPSRQASWHTDLFLYAAGRPVLVSSAGSRWLASALDSTTLKPVASPVEALRLIPLRQADSACLLYAVHDSEPGVTHCHVLQCLETRKTFVLPYGNSNQSCAVLGVSRDGRFAVLALGDGSVSFCDLADQDAFQLHSPHNGNVGAAAISPCGAWFATFGANSAVGYRTDRSDPVWSYRCSVPIEGMTPRGSAAAPVFARGHRLLVVPTRTTVIVLDGETGRHLVESPLGLYPLKNLRVVCEWPLMVVAASEEHAAVLVFAV